MNQPERASQRSRKPAPRWLSIADRYYERGLDYYAKKKLDLAIADMDAAIKHDPKKAEYYVARGLILLQSNWDTDAEKDFAHGLKLDPTQWLAHYGRGITAFKEGNYAQAIDHFSRAQHIEPSRPEIYFHRAVAFFHSGNAEEAVQDMLVALKLFDLKDRRRQHAEAWLKIFREAGSPRGDT